MKKLLQYEISKFFCNKTIWVYLLLGVLISYSYTLWQVHDETDAGYSPKELSAQYQSLSKEEIKPKALGDRLEQLQLELSEDSSKSEIQTMYMLQHIYTRGTNLEEYTSYRESVITQSNEKLDSAIFGKQTGFAKRNLQLTKETYENLQEGKIKNDYDDGILLLTGNRLQDMMMLLFLIIFILRLFIQEREQGTWFLYKSMKNGHGKLLTVKLLLLLILTAGMATILYGGNAIILHQLVGFGDASRAIQSVDGYMTSSLPLQVGEYIFYRYVTLVLTFTAVALVLAVLGVLFRDASIFIATTIGTLVLEYGLWQFIPWNSWAMPAKEMNLIAMIYSEHYYMDYYNINLLSIPISNQQCGICTMGMGIALSLLCTYCIHESGIMITSRTCGKWKICLPRKQKKAKRDSLHFPTKCMGLAGYEWYKQLIVNKGILILLLFLVIQTVLSTSTDYYMTREEYYYRMYALELQGKSQEEGEAYIAGELEVLGDGISATDKPMQIVGISQSRRDAFLRVVNDFYGVDTKNGGEFVYQTPWQILFGNTYINGSMWMFLLCTIAILLMESSVGELEQRSGMQPLMVASKRGYVAIIKQKMVLYSLIAAFLSGYALIPGLYKVIQCYGLYGMKAKARSINGVTFLLKDASLGLVLVSHILLFVLALWIISWVILYVSEKYKSRIRTILFGATIFVFPVLCYLLIQYAV